jgi:hypothetical protein
MSRTEMTAPLIEIREDVLLAAAAVGNPRLAPSGRREAAAELAHWAPRLLAAVEAVLELHQPGLFVPLGGLCKDHEVYRHFSITSDEADRARACPDCTATVHLSCTCGSDSFDRCAHRHAITSALAGVVR